MYFLVPWGFNTHLQGAIPATLVVLASFAAYKSAAGSLFSRAVIAASFYGDVDGLYYAADGALRDALSYLCCLGIYDYLA